MKSSFFFSCARHISEILIPQTKYIISHLLNHHIPPSLSNTLLTKVWSDVLAIERHNTLQARNGSNESRHGVLFQWLLSCSSKVLCIVTVKHSGGMDQQEWQFGDLHD